MIEIQAIKNELNDLETLGGKNIPDLFRQIFLSAPVALAIYAPGGPILLNPACEDLLRETVGTSAQVWQRWLAGAMTRLEANGSWRDVVVGNVVGRPEVEITLGPHVTPTGHRVLTLRRLAVSEHGSESLAETVSTLYHELRTPLTSMKSSLNLVRTREAGPLNDDQDHFLGMTLRNIDRLDRLVGDLLDTSRAAAGSLVLKLVDGDLAPVLGEALELHAEAARTAGLVFVCEDLPTMLPARVDQDKVVQMVSNVVGNAIKFTPSGGRVEVSILENPAGDKFSIIVTDTGPGMDQKALSQVFEPFKRVHDENNCHALGSGLGLHITQGLVRALGGDLNLESKPGQGTMACIELPRWMEPRDNPKIG